MQWDSYDILFLASFFFFLTSVLAMLLFVFLDHMWSKLTSVLMAPYSLLEEQKQKSHSLLAVYSRGSWIPLFLGFGDSEIFVYEMLA